MTISVAMCTYNGARYIDEQLDGIATQVRLPDELVVCDDGSGDDTISRVSQFAAKAKFPVRIEINHEKLGPARNFGKAIGLCQGTVIALSDQDDIWKPTKLERLSKALTENPSALYTFSDAEIVDEQGKPLGQKLWATVGLRKNLLHFRGTGQLELLLRYNMISGASMMLRSSFREVFLPIPAGWMHDHWIVLLASIYGEGVPVDETLWGYRRHAAQVCGWGKQKWWEVLRTSLKTENEEIWRKVDTFQKLREQVCAVGCIAPPTADRLRLVEEKEFHLRKRADNRSRKGFPRFAGVITEALSGRYHRYSNSWQSIVRDL
jgi:glycosyltransferase involved in cell wall biosynthesis